MDRFGRSPLHLACEHGKVPWHRTIGLPAGLWTVGVVQLTLQCLVVMLQELVEANAAKFLLDCGVRPSLEVQPEIGGGVLPLQPFTHQVKQCSSFKTCDLCEDRNGRNALHLAACCEAELGT